MCLIGNNEEIKLMESINVLSEDHLRYNGNILEYHKSYKSKTATETVQFIQYYELAVSHQKTKLQKYITLIRPSDLLQRAWTN